MKKVIILIMFLTISSFAQWATENRTGRITTINQEGSVVRVWFTATDLQDPQGTGQFGVALFDANTNEGKAKLSILLTAMQGKNPVKLWVNGKRSAWEGKEWPILGPVYLMAN